MAKPAESVALTLVTGISEVLDTESARCTLLPVTVFSRRTMRRQTIEEAVLFLFQYHFHQLAVVAGLALRQCITSPIRSAMCASI